MKVLEPPLRILLAHQRCAISGVEAWLVDLWRAFRALGHTCELFFFYEGPMAPQLPAECVAHFGGLEDCRRLVERGGFDVVHAETTDWEVGIAAVRGLAGPPRLVLTAQTAPVSTWTSRNCDAVAGCSEWLAAAQQALTDLPVQVVPNGVDTTAFTPAAGPGDGPPIVAWVGRGSDLKLKRIDRFAAIAPALAAAGLRIRLADPDGPGRVLPAAAEALRPVVDFWGPVPREAMPRFFHEVAASGGCVVSTSRREGLPLALLEAQACGCPVIGPATRGVTECVDPAHGGVLYAPGAPAAELGRLVLDTLEDCAGMRWRRKGCVQYVRHRFSLDRMAREYLRIYRAACSRDAERPVAVGSAWPAAPSWRATGAGPAD